MTSSLIPRLLKSSLRSVGLQALRHHLAPSIVLRSYMGRDGKFDYNLYKNTQNDANRQKLNNIWVQQENVDVICDYIINRGVAPKFGICHGVRRGNEQKWFSDKLGCEVIGTDIADSASQFANTIQHDFHDVREEWLGRADFIYSNSFDHAYDPEKALTAWVSSLRSGGLIFLEHTSGHEAAATNSVDPFGADLHIMPFLVLQWGKGKFCIIDIMDLPKKHAGIDFAKCLVIRQVD